MSRYLMFALLSVTAACGDDLPTAGGGSTGTTGAAASTGAVSSTGPAADDTGTDSSGGPPPELVFDAALDLEIIRSIDVRLDQVGETYQVTLDPNESYGVLAPGATLSGPARIDRFPEAGARLYTARISAPAVPDGPCGEEPISLSLSLHHDDDTSFVAGGLTPYCGADTWYGVPVIEPLRISGHLP